MPILKNKCENNFIIIPNQLAQAAKQGIISYRALGIVVDMLSRPSEWVFHKNFYCSKKEGICSITKAFKELQKAGYLKLENTYEKGRIKDRTWYVCNEPIYFDAHRKKIKGDRP